MKEASGRALRAWAKTKAGGRHVWTMTQAYAVELWTTFSRDVWRDPTIRPFTAVLLSALVLLIAWLTIEYAPEAAERGKQRYGEDPDGVISVVAGYWTITVMAILTLAAGFEPILGQRIERWWRQRGGPWFRRIAKPTRWALIVLLGWPFATAKALSLLWSVVDTALARLIGILAGAALPGAPLRYGHFLMLMLAFMAAGLLAPPHIGLQAILLGLLAVLAIVRRWSWIEADRETFLIERGERESGKSVLRVGFREDLRDEALVALAFLFVLIPLGLDQLQTATCAVGNCAFSFNTDATLPQGGVLASFERFGLWLGYFGAELAKTVPFVDWSEVFHVANGSPLKAETTIGSQAAFVLRAGLDLLFLAAVLQAVQIATRLREQSRAFMANRLPILEPFAERLRFLRLAEGLIPELDLRTSEQPAIAAFPRYEADRLKELVGGTEETSNLRPHLALAIRKAAAALLQQQHKGEETDKFFTRRAREEPNPTLRAWVVEVGADLDPDDEARRQDDARRARLAALIADADDGLTRLHAVRALGRMAPTPDKDNQLLELLENSEVRFEVRAAAAVALANGGTQHACEPTKALAEATPDDGDPTTVTAAMATAFALARLDPDGDNIQRFKRYLLPQIAWAMTIQVEPIHFPPDEEPSLSAAAIPMIALRPGQEIHPATFIMGARDIEAEGLAFARPLRRISMDRSFALGQVPVSHAEYQQYLAAHGATHDTTRTQEAQTPAYMNWYEANAFAHWMSQITGRFYRLPSEAEWEYACRAGSETLFHWGDEWDKTKSPSALTAPNANYDQELAQYSPNAWGFYDMHGNVFQWCSDPAHASYEGTPPDNQCPWVVDADFSRRIARGGSRYSQPESLSAANRRIDLPTFNLGMAGLRLACALGK